MKPKYKNILDKILKEIGEKFKDVECGEMNLNNKEYAVLPVGLFQGMIQETLESFIRKIEEIE